MNYIYNNELDTNKVVLINVRYAQKQIGLEEVQVFTFDILINTV